VLIVRSSISHLIPQSPTHSRTAFYSSSDVGPSGVCYGCNVLLRENNNADAVMESVVASNKRKLLTRAEMKDQISEFLLQEDE
jgi:hypothetical protein